MLAILHGKPRYETNCNIKHKTHPAVFPSEIPHRLIKLFTFVGETVLDPFSGTGTTAKVAFELERQAICVEQNQKYIDELKKELEDKKTFPENWLVMKTGDSRDLSFIEDNTIGVVITSPPYWNKADYGKNKTNLGNISNYRAFFKEIKPVFEECYRVLMPGRKICIVTANVNQHTNHGLLTFPLATDFSNLLREIGFVMINEIIWTKNGTGGRWGSWGKQRPIFGSYPYPPNFLFKNVHEYILIFMKPSGKEKNGPKVENYEMLMDSTKTKK